MKVVFSLLVMAGLLCAGCGKQAASSAQPTNTSSSGNPLTAPVDYLGAVARAQQTARKVVSTVGLDQAVKMFYGQEGRYPKDLNELVPDYLPNIPPAPTGMQYSYDPKTGVLKVVPK